MLGILNLMAVLCLELFPKPFGASRFRQMTSTYAVGKCAACSSNTASNSCSLTRAWAINKTLAGRGFIIATARPTYSALSASQVQWNASRDGYEPTFANARYWTASGQWQLAMKPNAREKATFLTENIMPLSDRGVLHYLDQQEVWPFEFMDIRYAFGHTEQMMIPVVNYGGKKVVFMADLVPSHAHLPVPWVMGYDTQPLQSMVEKEALLQEAAAQQYVLYFDHDPFFDCCTVQQTERGIRVLESGRLSDFI
jgi:hypothetical protein